jgi:5'-nucleotidase
MVSKYILVDMDEVVFFTNPDFNKKLKQRFPNLEVVSYENTTEFDFEKLYPEHLREQIHDTWYEEGLFRNLHLVSGALESLAEMRKKHSVWLCTSPVSTSHCYSEKYEAILEKLGRYWTKRLITSRDKTLILGDILIDDNPLVSGERKPLWEHILYTRPWNLHIQDKRRLTWANWKQVLPELI